MTENNNKIIKSLKIKCFMNKTENKILQNQKNKTKITE